MCVGLVTDSHVCRSSHYSLCCCDGSGHWYCTVFSVSLATAEVEAFVASAIPQAVHVETYAGERVCVCLWVCVCMCLCMCVHVSG